MRVILDTNILTRAVGSRHGPASELFERICYKHILIVSSELLAELARVLSYDRVRRMHRLSEAAIEEFIENLEIGATLVSLPNPIPRIVPHDPDDDIVIATAVAGSGDVICTRNRHFLHEKVASYCREHAIEIMDDVALLAMLRKNEAGS